MKLIYISLIILLLSYFPQRQHPGKERWTVKICTDPLSNSINTTPIFTNTSSLILLTAPHPFPKNDNSSRHAQEKQTYTITTTIRGFKQETDGDYHIVVGDTSDHTMICEIPNPDYVNSSRFSAQIKATRSKFEQMFGIPSKYKKIQQKVTLTAVLFFT